MSLKEMSYNQQTQALLNEKFLATLSEQRERDIYAKIISLDINENPIDEIEGKVSGGSINIDGTSIIRRTCSLTMISDKIEINEYYWGLKTKFKLEIGLRNKLTGEYSSGENSLYPDIVWFPQGYYLITGFNTSIGVNNCTISLSGKDKMSLLNGDLGGQLFASIDFGTEETVTTVMEEVKLNTITSSENIALKNYYIKPTKNLPDQILINDSKYSFISNKKNGLYYKRDNFYYKLANDENRLTNLKYYDMYKLIDSPDDLYIDITSKIEEYKKNKFFYFIENKYLLDSNDLPVRDRQYYKDDEGNEPIEIYVADKYYYIKNEGYPYYILDSTTIKEDSRNYYSLVPLYQKFEDITIKKINIEKIIREAVHTYAKEPYHNIIINDLDEYGLEQLTYKGDTPLYALYDIGREQFTKLMLGNSNADFETIINQAGFDIDPLTSATTSYNGSRIGVRNKEFLGRFKSEEEGYIPYKKEKDSDEYIIYNYEPNDILYTVAKIEYGTDVGYRLTDLVYTGDLIAGIGETLTSVLDKIKTMLGDFEYFYDEKGRFIFQKKKTCVNTSWSQLTDNKDETYVTYANDKQKFSFNFENGRLISTIQNSPVLNNLRNDYIAWGKRKGISGAEIPIHVRYAIDKKPVFYKALDNQIYTTDIKFAIQQGVISQESYKANHSTIAEDVASFSLSVPYVEQMISYGLTPPQKDEETHRWSPGWWDIRDWARYYKLLKYGDEENAPNPNGTMKFYSSGDEEGCISLQTLKQQLDQKRNDTNNREGAILNSNIGHAWLIEIKKDTKVVNLQHGFGTYNPNNKRSCVYHESNLNSDGNIITLSTNKTKEFPAPYSGCADNHTYQYFLQDTNEYDVYFYNPNFPFGETEEELIENQLLEEYGKWEEERGIHIVDWREIIYQMALDYFAGQGCSIKEPVFLGEDQFDDNNNWSVNYYAMTDPDDFLYEVGQRNPYYYPTGYTGYEQYYTDMQGFWRQLYNPDYVPTIKYSTGKYKEEKILSSDNTGSYVKRKVWIPSQIEEYTIEYYISKIKKAIQIQKKELDDLYDETTSTTRKKELEKMKINYEKYMPDLSDAEASKKLYWNCEVFAHPETLNFWIDFLDSDSELAQFAISQVGDRSKVINESKTTSIIYTEVPNFILYDKNESKEDGTCDESKLNHEISAKSGYNFIYLPKGFSQFFTISYRSASLKDKIDEMLYQYGYCTENITITAMPIYYLKPNTRIFVQDKNTGIDGEYLVSKITLSLAYNGTMSITATKAPERLY